MNSNERRFGRNLMVALGAYTALVLIVIWVIQTGMDGPWRYLLALMPVSPIFFALRAYLRYLDRLDELQQRIQLQSLAISAGATGLLTLAYGFLENAGMPAVSIIWVFPLLIFLWGGASIVLTRRYQ